MAHKLHWWWGAEDQQAARWRATAGTAPSFSSSFALFSRWSFGWDGSAAGVTGTLSPGTIGADGLWIFAGIDNTYLTFHIYFESLPAAGNFAYLVRIFRSAGANLNALRIDENGKLAVFNDNGSTWATSVAGISAGVWYAITFECKKNGPLSAIARLVTTGATVASITHGSNTTNNAVNEMYVGPYSASRGKWWMDNLVWEADASAANIDDPVNLLTTRYAIGMPTPNGPGFYDAWTGNYLDCDDFPHDGDATYRREAVGGIAFTHTFTPTTGLVAQISVVHGIIGFGFVRQETASSTVGLRIRSGTTDSDLTLSGPSTSYEIRHHVRTTDPNTGAAWTVSALDSVQVGYRRGGTNAVRCTNTGYEVLYTIGAVTRERKIHYLRSLFHPRKAVLDADSGRELEYNELRAGRWQKKDGLQPPTAYAPNSWFDEPTLSMLESVVVSGEGGKMELGQTTSPDDFVTILVGRVQSSNIAPF